MQLAEAQPRTVPAAAPPGAPVKPARLLSLDAYRGFIMLLLSTSAFQLHKLKTSPGFESNYIWDKILYQFSHPLWRACSFWDLIQPSFMFMVGVAAPYSIASRRARSESEKSILIHTLWRSLLLVLLGVFLSSNGAKQTNWTFVNVLSQIGLGYPVVVLLTGRTLKTQSLALAGIALGSWLLYALYPAPGPDFDWAAAGVKHPEQQFGGFAAHWSMNANIGRAVDLWFLNLFPPHNFKFNDGGYATINFIPSLVTMILGLLAGELLKGPRAPMEKFKILMAAGAACLGLGILCDPQILPGVENAWVLCPVVKRIWTPSFAFFSSGWTLWMLAAFYWTIDLRGWKRWTFPFVVVGMNSIAMYCMWQLLKGWLMQSVHTHFGRSLFEGTYGPVWSSLTWAALLWGICYWMYRRQIFLRV